MFQGYSPEAQEFLWGIRFNNDRAWFQARKETYLRCLYEPTAALGEEIYQRFAAKRPRLGLDLHVSRIYRDARRLHGRGPYKDHLWVSLRAEHDVWTQRPVFWFEVAPEGWSYGVGCWNAAPSTMAALRRDIDGGGKEIARLARRLARQDVFVLQGEDYARPKGDPSPLLTPWYNKKRISIGCDRPFDDLVCSPALVDTLIEGFEFLLPYFTYFDSLCKNGLEDLK